MQPQFLDPEEVPQHPAFAVLPFGYEGTVSYGGGTSCGPKAIIDASHQVEFYDEQLECEPCERGIITLTQPDMPTNPEEAVNLARQEVASILEKGMFPVVLGGEHSISYGVYLALSEKYGDIGVIQIDAHSDLREEYQGNSFSHACVMSRIREHTDKVIQLGIRNLSREEAELIKENNYSVGFIHKMRNGEFDLDAALDSLPDKIFFTFDVDGLDLSLVRSTGTPDPGGFTWPEINAILFKVADRKRLVGFDMVELCPDDPASAFTVARLTYRMMGLAL